MEKKTFDIRELLNERSKQIKPTEIQEPSEEMELVYLDIDELIEDENNIISPKKGEELKESIELVGVLQPLLVKRQDDGLYKVTAGHKRLKACKELVEEGKDRFKKIPCVEKEYEDDTTIWNQIALIVTNSTVSQPTGYEKMIETLKLEELIGALKKDENIAGKRRELLAGITNRAASTIGNYRTIKRNLSACMMEAFKTEQINYSVALAVSQLSETDQERAYHLLQTTGKLSLPEIKEFKKNIQAAAEPPKEQFAPNPKSVSSICWSCTRYTDCYDKGDAVTSCPEYKNKSKPENFMNPPEEAQEAAGEESQPEEETKVEEDQEEAEEAAEEDQTEDTYEEDQLAADAAEEDQMAAGTESQESKERTHYIRISHTDYDLKCDGTKSFELIKNDYDFKVGDLLERPEYKKGEKTGRSITEEVVYILQDCSGLADGYCILGTVPVEYDI